MAAPGDCPGDGLPDRASRGADCNLVGSNRSARRPALGAHGRRDLPRSSSRAPYHCSSRSEIEARNGAEGTGKRAAAQAFSPASSPPVRTSRQAIAPGAAARSRDEEAGAAQPVSPEAGENGDPCVARGGPESGPSPTLQALHVPRIGPAQRGTNAVPAARSWHSPCRSAAAVTLPAIGRAHRRNGRGRGRARGPLAIWSTPTGRQRRGHPNPQGPMVPAPEAMDRAAFRRAPHIQRRQRLANAPVRAFASGGRGSRSASRGAAATSTTAGPGRHAEATAATAAVQHSPPRLNR